MNITSLRTEAKILGEEYFKIGREAEDYADMVQNFPAFVRDNQALIDAGLITYEVDLERDVITIKDFSTGHLVGLDISSDGADSEDWGLDNSS